MGRRLVLQPLIAQGLSCLINRSRNFI